MPKASQQQSVRALYVGAGPQPATVVLPPAVLCSEAYAIAAYFMAHNAASKLA